MIQIGPAGLGTPPIDNLRLFKKLGFSCAEVEFVRNIYMNAETAKKVGDEAKKLGVSLSIHCPYAINLASDDKEKIEASKKRILKSCEIGHYLKARYIVFHPAYYGKHNPEIIYNKVKDSILEMQEEINKNNWNVILCPETAGKLSQFGSLEELKNLIRETNCSVCVDFAHIKARNIGVIDYSDICKKLRGIKDLTAHFSGIKYGARGEISHLITTDEDINLLLKNLIEHKIDIRIISESPDPINDGIRMLKTLSTIVG